MKKELIYFDESGFKSLVKTLKRLQETLHPIMNEFQGITKKQPNTEDFKRVFTYPINHVDEKEIKECVFDKLTEGKKVGLIDGLIFRKEKAYEMFEMPDLSGIFQLIRNITIMPGNEGAFNEKYFKMEDGVVVIDEPVLEQEKENFKIYIQTKEEKQRFEAVKKLMAGVQGVVDILDYKGWDRLENIKILGVIQFSHSYKGEGYHKLAYNPKFIKTGQIDISDSSAYTQGITAGMNQALSMSVSDLKKQF